MKNRKFYPWLVVALLWVVALLNYMDRQMLSTMQAEMKVDIRPSADSVPQWLQPSLGIPLSTGSVSSESLIP